MASARTEFEEAEVAKGIADKLERVAAVLIDLQREPGFWNSLDPQKKCLLHLRLMTIAERIAPDINGVINEALV